MTDTRTYTKTDTETILLSLVVLHALLALGKVTRVPFVCRTDDGTFMHLAMRQPLMCVGACVYVSVCVFFGCSTATVDKL